MCDGSSPPILCLLDEPEGPYELHVGGRVLLPGECIEGPADEGGGRVRAVLHASGQPVGRQSLRVPAGRRTWVRVDGDGVEVDRRSRCDGQVDPSVP